jgi:hypothetical protein
VQNKVVPRTEPPAKVAGLLSSFVSSGALKKLIKRFSNPLRGLRQNRLLMNLFRAVVKKLPTTTYHKGTESTEVAQRNSMEDT